jgi:hypothetical protein
MLSRLTKHTLNVCIVSWTRTFEAIIHGSRKHQPTQAVWIFHRVLLNLVLKTVGIMRRVHIAFKDFDDPDRDYARFVELRIFPSVISS